MRVLVTGGLGFIGRAVARELVSNGHSVDVLSRGRPGATPPGGAGLLEVDIRDREAIGRVGRGYDGYCHLAALTSVRASFGDPLIYWEVNLGGTLNLLRAASAGGDPPRFVLASTNIVYGTQSDGAFSEDLPPHPENPYAESKVAAERLLGGLAGAGLVRATTLRVFNAAGAADGIGDSDPGRLIPNLVRAARGAEFSVNGDGSVIRDYTHVLDVATAFRLALEADTDGPATYNVGTGVGASVREAIRTVEEVAGTRIAVRRLPATPEQRHSVADPTRIRRELGWSAPYSDLVTIVRDAWQAV
jgi:UDP-glucose 4-epimerase